VAVGAIGVWVPLFVINQFSTSHAPLPPTRQVITTDVSAVTVNVASGSVTVERGSGSGAVVTSSGYRGQRTPTNHVRVSGHTLTVRSSCASGLRLGWCTRNYVLEVPARTAVTAHLGTGAVEVSGVDGPLDLQSDDGSITVTGTTGSVHASSGTGRVTVEHVDGAVDAASQDGEVQVAEASGTVRATSGTGSVTLSGLTGPSVDAHSNDGRVTVGFAQGASPPNQVTATSGTGAVTVSVPPSGTYRVVAVSATGSASNEVRSDPTSPHTIRASSTDGDVTVQYAPGWVTAG